MLDSHMQVRFGMESEETRSKCPNCKLKKEIAKKDEMSKTQAEKFKEKYVCTCHCKYADISEE